MVEYVEKSNLIKISGKTAYFQDGSSNVVDAIILCTGYNHNFPFLENKLKLKAKNTLWINQLYKGVFWGKNMKLSFLGMQDQYYTFTMFDVQAWYVRDVILGRIQLSTNLVEIEASDKLWSDKFDKLNGDHDEIVFQGEYVESLMKATDYPDIDIDAVNKLFFDWENLKIMNILNYRNGVHKSVITGKVSKKHKLDWIES